MKKKILVVALIVLLLAAICVVTIVKHNTVSEDSSKTKVYTDSAEAMEAAGFGMEYSDRLAGYTPTEYEVNSSTVEIRYGDAGFIRKTLGVSDNSGEDKEYTEKSEQTVNGMNITFKGKDGLVYIASWTYNNYGYTISIKDGVKADEMTEYIMMTW